MSQEKDPRSTMHISQPTCPKGVQSFFKVWQTEEEIEDIVFKQRWEIFFRYEKKQNTE